MVCGLLGFDMWRSRVIRRVESCLALAEDSTDGSGNDGMGGCVDMSLLMCDSGPNPVFVAIRETIDLAHWAMGPSWRRGGQQLHQHDWQRSLACWSAAASS